MCNSWLYIMVCTMEDKFRVTCRTEEHFFFKLTLRLLTAFPTDALSNSLGSQLLIKTNTPLHPPQVCADFRNDFTPFSLFFSFYDKARVFDYH